MVWHRTRQMILNRDIWVNGAMSLVLARDKNKRRVRWCERSLLPKPNQFLTLRIEIEISLILLCYILVLFLIVILFKYCRSPDRAETGSSSLASMAELGSPPPRNPPPAGVQRGGPSPRCVLREY